MPPPLSGANQGNQAVDEANTRQAAAEEEARARRAAKEKEARARRQAAEVETARAEKEAFNRRVAEEEANNNTKTRANKQGQHPCSVQKGYHEVEFKMYANSGDPRFKEGNCSNCKKAIKEATAYACTHFWMAEFSDPTHCERPFLCRGCYEKENATTTGKRERKRKQPG